MAFSSMVKDINRKIILESFWDFSRNTKQDITKKTELSFQSYREGSSGANAGKVGGGCGCN